MTKGYRSEATPHTTCKMCAVLIDDDDIESHPLRPRRDKGKLRMRFESPDPRSVTERRQGEGSHL